MWKIEELLQASMLHFDTERISVSCTPCSDQGISVWACTEEETESKDKAVHIAGDPEAVLPHSQAISLCGAAGKQEKKTIAGL